jgi:hypothetical protein
MLEPWERCECGLDFTTMEEYNRHCEELEREQLDTWLNFTTDWADDIEESNVEQQEMAEQRGGVIHDSRQTTLEEFV